MPSVSPDDRVGRVIDLLTESSLGRWLFIQQSFANDTMYLGHIPPNEVPLPGLSYILINKTSQAIISHAQIQVETRPRIIIAPRQTSSTPEYWMTRKALQSIKSAIDGNLLPAFEESQEAELIVDDAEETADMVESEGFTFGLLDQSKAGAFEVTEAFLERVKPLLQPWMTISGQPAAPLITPSDILVVDDTITAKCVQNNLDNSWEADDRDLWLRNNIVNCLKFGTQGVQFVFDKERRMSKVFDIHVLNLFLPPNCTGIKDAEYVIVREITSAKEAKERFPYATKTIDEFQQRSTNGNSLSSTMADQPPYLGVQFGRNMVEIWHIWLRNERFPMSPDEALDQGRIVLRNGQMLLTDEDYNVTQEVVEVGNGKWPTKLGIRYQQMISTEMIYDEQCAHCDIPVALNQNIPVSYSPWHQGEPERLWFAQKLIDKISSIIIDHITYFRSPQQILPASVYKRWKGLNAVYSHPARDTWLDDTTFDNYREFLSSGRGFYVEPPNMPDKYVDLWQLSMELFDTLSGHAAVLQGQAPGANSSGKVVAELQNAARSTIGFKAASTEAMLRNIARLDIDAWAKWMPLFQWKRANDDVPVEVLAAIRERSRRMEYDVTVEVASGGGEVRQQKKQNAMVEVMQGVRSPESYRRLAEIQDEDKEWISPAQQAAMPAQPQANPEAAPNPDGVENVGA